MTEVRVIVVPASDEIEMSESVIEVRDVEGELLHRLQDLIGGYVERCQPRVLADMRQPSVDPTMPIVLVDEDGVAKELPLNRRVTLLWRAYEGTRVRGTAIIIGERAVRDDEGVHTIEWTGLPSYFSLEYFTSRLADRDLQLRGERR